MRDRFRVGDVLEISSEFTEAEVARVSPLQPDVVLKWPWWSQDPDVDWIEWNGEVAIATDPSRFDYANEIFRIQPPRASLQAGGTCRVGIPPTTVHVIQVEHFDPPRETGWLPRPKTSLILLRAGHSEDPALEDQGFSIDPDDEIPYDLRLLFRPYAFLELDDEVADANHRAWRFDDPWRWRPFDEDHSREPLWPLKLLTRNGEPDADAAEQIATVTSAGSYRDDQIRWRQLAKAVPPRAVITREFGHVR